MLGKLRWLALIAICLAAPSPYAAAQGQAKSQSYAFLVGCSKYEKTEFAQLPYTGNDVLGFQSALRATGFAEDRIAVLHDNTKEPTRYLPTKANILHELDLLLAGMTPSDTLVVALSGHGLQFKGDPVSYFVPLDGRLMDKTTLIPLDGKGGLYERIKDSKAKQKLLIVNACRNDPTAKLSFATTKVDLVDEDRKEEVPEGIAAIYSCEAGQMSYYDPDRKMAIFFDHVIRAWKGEYTKDGTVTLERFFQEVKEKTTTDARKTLRAVQVPLIMRDYKGEWMVVSAERAKTLKNERSLEVEFAEYYQRCFLGKAMGDKWIEQHAPSRAAAWKDLAEHGSTQAMLILGNCLVEGKGLPKDEAEALKWFRKAADLGIALGHTRVAWMYAVGRGVPKRDDAEALKWYRKAAELGCPVGQSSLGNILKAGRGVPRKDEEEAVWWYRKSAAQDCPLGQYNLGSMYAAGRGLPKKDEEEAVKWYRKAAEQGYDIAQNSLANMYVGGRGGLKKDDEAAVLWYRKAAEQGLASAQYNLGLRYEAGRGVPMKDDKEALQWFRKAAEQNNVRGQHKVGLMYANGRGMPKKDDAEAAKWYRKAADQGFASAQISLGEMYEAGRGVPKKDEEEALKWYRKAADQGNTIAQTNLGIMYANGRGMAKKDDDEAVKWYRKAADKGNVRAQYHLGWMNEHGRGIPKKDDEEAVKWYRKAADKGYTTAQNALGLMYANGRGVPKKDDPKKDDEEAVKWYRKAADKGLASAQANLGRMYELGRGVPKKDEKEALQWFRKAAEQNYTPSQYTLGVMYENGRGVQADVAEALKWYQLASKAGHDDATKAVKRLQKK